MGRISLNEALRLEQRIRKVSEGRHDNILRLNGDGLTVTHYFSGRPLNSLMALKDEMPGIEISLRDPGPSRPETVFVRYELPSLSVLEGQFKRFKQIDAASFFRLINYARALHKQEPKRVAEMLSALQFASEELFKPSQSSSG